MSLDNTVVTNGLSLAVPFSGHWRAPSNLPRIHYAPSKIIWEAGVDPTASRGLKLGPFLSSVPPDSRKSGEEGAGVSLAVSSLGLLQQAGAESSSLPHCPPLPQGLFISLSDEKMASYSWSFLGERRSGHGHGSRGPCP